MYWNKTLLIVLLVTISSICRAQLLQRQVTIRGDRYRIQSLLEIISNEGNFFFSYNSALVPRDSLVNYAGGTRSINNALSSIFPAGMEFIESGNYIIIRRKPLQISLITQQQKSDDAVYLVTGFVRDDQTGEQLTDASVYEKTRLQSTLTNRQGYFKLKLKTRYRSPALTISKTFYQDTTVQLQPGFDQQLSLTLLPAEFSGANIVVGPGRHAPPDSLYIEVPQPDSSSILYLYQKADSFRVQRTAMGKFLLSSRLQVQSLNLSRFFTARPVQVSFVPALSTNGRMNGQVVNNFSLNLLGGYSAGTKGVEIGGLFNINRRDVEFVQVGGLFNLVGGSTKGFQVGGIANTVMGPVGGVQVGGVANTVLGSVKGVQIGGVSNFVRDTVKGVQISGVINYTRRLSGLQIGLINITDSSSGYSIGLINVVLKGYHKLALYGTELTPFNAAFKTGNHRLYSILMGGVQPDTARRIVSFGYGVGTEMRLGKMVGINAELGSQYCYTGSWENTNLWNRASLNLRFQIGKWFAIYGGPAYNAMYSDQRTANAGWKFPVTPSRYNPRPITENWTGWLGWTAGIHVF